MTIGSGPNTPLLPLPPPLLAGISSPPSSTSIPHPDLFHQVPKAYHDYLDVFSESQANILPPHRKYDLSIPLQPGAAPPWGPIYSMSTPELTVLGPLPIVTSAFLVSVPNPH